jgi:hypothetical protein
MFIFIVGENQPLDENSKRNPLKSLVRIIEKSSQLSQQAQQAWEEQTEALNLKLKDKIREATIKLNNIDAELMNAELLEMQLLDMIPTGEFHKN